MMQANRPLLITYIIGFITCLALTLLAFTLVGQSIVMGETAFATIIVLAVIQFLVQVKCFLHVSLKPTARWKLVTLIFTVIVLLILVCGSLWIMWSLNQKMMIH